MKNAATLNLFYLYALICLNFTATYPKNERFCMHCGASGVGLFPVAGFGSILPGLWLVFRVASSQELATLKSGR